MHYMRWQRNGDPLSLSTPPQEERLRARVDRTTTPDGCWPWTGYADSDGYGRVVWNGHGQPASRAAYEDASGITVPRDFVVGHTCDNPICMRNDEEGTYEVNGKILPRWGHLWLGTIDDNNVDKAAKERSLKGTQVNSAKLNDEQVREGRMLFEQGMSTVAIGQRFAISQAAAYAMVHHRTWKHVK